MPPRSGSGPAGAGGGCSDDPAEEPAAAALAVAPLAAGGVGRPGFRYWVDELLWSQGRAASIELEEVLDAMGGTRVGGPHKLLPRTTRHTQQQQQSDASAAAAAAAAVGGLRLGSGSSSGSSQPAALPDSSGAAAGPSGGTEHAAAPATSAISRADSDQESGDDEPAAASSSSSNEPAGGGARRVDERLLGYHAVDRWELLWTKSVYAIKAARSLAPGQLVSALAGLNCLTMKKRMVLTLRQALGPAAFRILPLSFAVPEDLPAWRAWLASPAAAAADSGLWMLKTGQDAGKGLRLVPTQHALAVASRPPRPGARPSSAIKVAQAYVADPLLLAGRKFHLRLWLLVTGSQPLRAYLHGAGLVLFASEPYDPTAPLAAGNGSSSGSGGLPGQQQQQPAAGHVTNLARNESTWVWGLDQLEQQLGGAAWEELWHQMRLSSALTVAAVLAPLRAAGRWLGPSIPGYGFQLLGLDFLVDSRRHAWLLEANSAPSIMAQHSQPQTAALIKTTKQAMLGDMMAMVQHRIGRGGPGGAAGGGWREDYAAEMAARGGFQPLMELFPLQHKGIPWQEQDLQLRQLMTQQAQQQQAGAAPPS